MAFKSKMTDLRPRREKYKRVITLVSGGYAKPSAFPGGKITVFPWDSAVDAWLQDEAKRLPDSEQETILYKIVEQVAHLNGCPLDDFLIGDVFTILLVARSIQNDNIIEYTAVCPDCSREEHSQVNVPNELEPVGIKKPDYSGTDLIVLPECQDQVELRPLRVKDEITVVTRTPEVKEKVSDYLARIIMPIVSINSGTPDTFDELLNWYHAIPPKDAKYLEEQEDLLTPHLSLERPHKCDRCGTFYKHPLVLNKEFFRSGRFTNAGGTLEKDIRVSVGLQGSDGRSGEAA